MILIITKINTVMIQLSYCHLSRQCVVVRRLESDDGGCYLCSVPHQESSYQDDSQQCCNTKLSEHWMYFSQVDTFSDRLMDFSDQYKLLLWLILSVNPILCQTIIVNDCQETKQTFLQRKTMIIWIHILRYSYLEYE